MNNAPVMLTLHWVFYTLQSGAPSKMIRKSDPKLGENKKPSFHSDMSQIGGHNKTFCSFWINISWHFLYLRKSLIVL